LLVATFLSPRVAGLLRTDPTIRELQLKTRDPHHLFPDVLGLAEGRAVQLTGGNSPFFRSVGFELGNQEMTAPAMDPIERDTVLSRLKLLFEFNENVDSEIEFCSLHFHEMNWADLDQLPIEIVQAILSRPSLKLRDEDSLFALIDSAVGHDPRFAVLLENVRFEYLSVDSMESFARIVFNSFDFVTERVWGAVVKRLLLDVFPPDPNDRSLRQWVECRYAGDRLLNGIIGHLSRKHGGSVVDKGVVSVTASTVGSPKLYPLRGLTDFHCGLRFFCTLNTANSWVCYDFGSGRIRPTHYAIRSDLELDDWHLRSWKLEGSIDGDSWVLLDRRTNEATLRGVGAMAGFSISQPMEVRMVRLLQTGPNSHPNNQLVLSALELFGWIRESSG
jgi:hypothetical protein